MVDKTFQFEIVAPEKMIFSKTVAMVTIPGGEGEYGVLIGHAPMITTVKAGIIEVYDSENTALSERIFVSGGFAEVTPSRCAVLAEEATPVSELNRTTLQSDAAKLAEQMATASDEDRAALEIKQGILAAKLMAAA